MRRLLTFILPLVLLVVVPRVTSASGASGVQRAPVFLSHSDRIIAREVAREAAANVHLAARRARARRGVMAAVLGPDGRTLVLHFRDGARAVLLPHDIGGALPPIRTLVSVRQSAPGSTPRAVVLEPFATELGDGATAGQTEADILTRAGFKVDVYRDAQVTVKLLLSLSQYSVIYMKTHAGVIPGGDAVIAAGDTSTAPYIKLFGKDAYYNGQHPNAPTILGQVFVDGGNGGLFNAIRAKFVTDELSPFPDSSVFFLNGCDILQAPQFLAALQSQNLSAVVTWDQEVRADAADRGLDYTLNQMASGDTLSEAVNAAVGDGVGTAYTANGPAHLRYVGDGDMTLRDALVEATPTPTSTPPPSPTVQPTAVPDPGAGVSETPTPLPARLSVKLAHSRLTSGQTQKVTVLTATGAFVKIRVTYPDKKRAVRTGHASAHGRFVWSFKEPSLALHGKARVVRVQVTVPGKKVTKRYTAA